MYGIITLFAKYIICVLLAILIGYNRGSSNHAAGVRTHVLVGVGALTCVVVALRTMHLHPNLNVDPFRLSAQVVSGIGFLGAGTIIKTGNYIRGLTTAASLWVVAILSIAIGCGYIIIAALTFISVYSSLKFFSKIKVLSTSQFQVQVIFLKYVLNYKNEQLILDMFKKYGIDQDDITTVGYTNINGNKEVNIKVDLKIHKVETNVEQLVKKLIKYEFVKNVKVLNEIV
ncbi:MAG: MgtC/SapB family protein [Bacilli bacterium]